MTYYEFILIFFIQLFNTLLILTIQIKEINKFTCEFKYLFDILTPIINKPSKIKTNYFKKPKY
jgi:hypothetical protein